MPSPSPEDPGLFIRDPYRFSDAMLIIPPPLVECLECFDGAHSDLDLRAALARITGRLETPADRPVIRKLLADFRSSQFRFKDLIVSLLLVREFPYREGAVHVASDHQSH